MKIKKNDNVVIIAGKDKGTKGKVLRTFPSIDKVVVDGVNIAKKHVKKGRGNSAGQIIEKPMPIHVSNVLISDPKTKKPTRVGYIIEDKKKIRVAKSSGQKI